jgi:type IV secretory pathway VirB4 component
MITVNIAVVEPAAAAKKVNRQITAIKGEISDKERKASGNGIFSDIIPAPLKLSLEQAEKLLADLQSKNEKMTLVNITIMVIANSYEELENNSEKIVSVFRKYLCDAAPAAFQQEKALASNLPLGNNQLDIRRTLTTVSTLSFMPFNAREMAHDGGFYYGLNQTTNNMIIFQRLNLLNPNGLILGAPGGGKSFSAKREISNSFLATADDILIIDPEREYYNLAKALGGEVIFVSENSKSHFNPLEITVVSDEDRKKAKITDDVDPVKAKYDFFLSFFETIMGRVTPEQKTIIDNCLHEVYREYLLNPCPKNMPTLVEYHKVLQAHPKKEEAKSLALSLELYVSGSMNVFSHQSNVDVNNRIVVYDVKDLGKQLKPLGMQIVLENLWAKIVQNRLHGKNTRVYIDEMYLFFRNEESANFFYELYKRARKWGGIPTGITQNVEDLLRSETGRAMLANTQFILMLNQNTTDRDKLSELLKIPENSMEFVNGSPPGSGLIYASGYGVIPFKDFFPKNTELYKLMTTKFGEQAYHSE